MQIAIIGLGLIGGSLGLVLKKRKWRKAEVTGYVRRPETGQMALEMGVLDKFELSLDRVVENANIVIISTPVLVVRDIFNRIAPHLPAGCIVTDTASTKSQVMEWAQELLPFDTNFIGGHPMAGKETFGVEAVDANLFNGSVYCLVRGSKTTSTAMQIVEDMVAAIGANPLLIDAQEHDNLVAGISHLPLLLSVALTLSTTRSPYWTQMSPLASTGYRDLSRLASGNPEVNASICLSNRTAIVRWIDEFSKELRRLRNLINSDSSEIQMALTIANEARRKWLEKH